MNLKEKRNKNLLYSEYMKIKIIIFVVFMISFFIVNPKVSLAQGVLPGIAVPTGIAQPGITCGDPNGSGDLNKCCQSTIYKPGAIHFNVLGLDQAIDLIQPVIDNFGNPILQKQKSVNLKPCIKGDPSTPGDINNSSCICILDQPKEPLSAFDVMCNRIKSPSEQSACRVCADKDAGAWTALGCFNGNLSEFITNNIMSTGIGIAGGISLLCIMLAAFQMQTSAGNAEKVKKAQELMTNCITGLMIIIFSVLILKIIGVDILRLPGFN